MSKQPMQIFSCVDDFVYWPNAHVESIVSSASLLYRKSKSRQKWFYKDMVCSFDIETSIVPYIEQSSLYMWQLQLGLENATIVGRTWDEFREFVDIIDDTLDYNERVVIYVHNLSYEFQFLRGVFNFANETVFCLDSREILKCTLLGGKIEFRCSMRLSGLGLATWAKNLNVPHQKLSGDEFNYKAVRYPWTPLTARQIEYGCNDVRAVVECVCKLMSENDDDLYTIPLTMTGFLRRDVKAALKKRYHYLRDIAPDYPLYQLCREAFRGGNTHANRYYAGQVLHNVRCADRSSSYPDVMCNRLFPVSKFWHHGAVKPEYLRHLLHSGKALLFRAAFTNIRLRNRYWGCPYLTYDKSRKVESYTLDNGRILEASYLETTLTDIDFEIVLDEYEFDDMAAIDVYSARYGKLPHEYTDILVKLYGYKTSLKGVISEDTLYRKSKERINSAYGMAAQNPVKLETIFTGEDYVLSDDKCEEELLDEYNEKGFLPYFWGVWVTVWARQALEVAIKLAGNRFVYCDTDSVYYLGDVDFTEFNNQCIENDLKSGMFATDAHGETHYSGVYEPDGDTYEEFATLGAKKYVKREHGVLKVTIAGVNKKEGAKELERMGGVEAFAAAMREDSELVFKKAGGTKSEYNDKGYSDLFGVVEVDGHALYISSNVTITDSTYTLGVTPEYERLLDACKDLGELAKYRGIDLDKTR